jgi:PAS domain S-box-containing protein
MASNVTMADGSDNDSPGCTRKGIEVSAIENIRKRSHRQPRLTLQLISITLYTLGIIFAFKLVKLLLLPPTNPLTNEFVIILSSCLAVNISATLILSKYQSLMNNLENRVELKTASLSQANQCLKIEIAENREARIFLENLLDTSADPIAMVNQYGKFIKWNKAAEKIFGFTRDEMRKKHFSNFYADQRQLDVMLSQLRRDGSVRNYEINMRKKDGNIAPFSISIGKLHGKNIKLKGSICIAREL